MEAKIKLAQKQLEKDTPELYEDLLSIKFEFPGALGVRGDGTDQDARLRLAGIWAISKSKICESALVQEYLAEPKHERRAIIVCAIADLLAFSGAMIVAALLIKEGMLQGCRQRVD